MNGTLAQLVALTCHANAALAGAIAQFFPGNSSCQFCESITFVAVNTSFFGRRKHTVVAATPDAWFAELHGQGVPGVRLALTPQNDPNMSDRMTAGWVGGGGNWWIEVMRPDGRRDYWVPHWEVGNREAPDQRIWRVTYKLVGTYPAAPQAPSDLGDITARLKTALAETHAFARRNDCEPFTGSFQSAIDCLADPNTCQGYHRDLHVDGLMPAQAVTLLQAIQSAWVFGGMGSWNDMGFEGATQAEYQRVSDALFDLLREAIVAAANSSLAGAAAR